MARRALPLVIVAAMALVLPSRKAGASCIVALQPIGKVRQETVNVAQGAMTRLWGAEVHVMPAQPLPPSAWYEPRQRYRAERLLDWLMTVSVPQVDRVVGLTASDISTTKDAYPDWGIFGLGQLSGRVCVVSTHRLGQGGTLLELSGERLVKVLNHELGHTFGLPHCPNPRCLMGDAEGSIGTVDRQAVELCQSCRETLRAQGLSVLPSHL